MPIPPSKVAKEFKPYWTTTDGDTVRLYHGHVLDVLKRMPSKSVQMVCTSPPYWGLRDYSTANWEGGNDPTCDHKHENRGTVQYLDRNGKAGSNNTNWQGAKNHSTVKLGDKCKKCGAKRIDQQLGSEKIHDCKQLLETQPGLYRKVNCAELDWASGCHVCRMVLIFREVRRVLRDDGCLFLNYGDSYGGGGGPPSNKSTMHHKPHYKQGTLETPSSKPANHNLPPGNLVGIPWRVALACQADGWVLRQDIIWHKPSPMPESVKNRCTKAHEYIFLLTKSTKYYYDAEAIKEKAQESSYSRYEQGFTTTNGKTGDPNNDALFAQKATLQKDGQERFRDLNGSNKRSVWTIPSSGYPGAHFAVYPPKLITPCILAGSSTKACMKCGSPWKRKTVEKQLTRERPNEYTKRTGEEGTGNSCANTVAGVEVKTVGWEPSCTCNGRLEKRKGVRLGYGSYRDHSMDGIEHGLRQDGNGPKKPGQYKADKEFSTTYEVYVSDIPLEDHPVRPCIVLDPFIGSGTTCAVSLQHGRWSWGIDLSEVYLKRNAIPRIEGKIRALGQLDLLHRAPSKPVQLNGVKFSG